MRKDFKKKFLIVICSCLVLLLVVFLAAKFSFIEVNNIDYLEHAMTPIDNLNSEDIDSIYIMLENYYVCDNEQAGFCGASFGKKSNTYVLEKIYYNTRLMEMIGELPKEMKIELEKIIESGKTVAISGGLSAIDVVSLLCIDNMIDGTYDEELLEIFLSTHLDEDLELLYENNLSDSIEDKVAFTVEVLNMFSESGVSVDFSPFQNGVTSYSKKTEFLLPEEGETLFNSGGLVLYAIDSLKIESDFTRYSQWFDEWKKVYSTVDISSWDDVLDVECVYLPIARIFDSEELSLEIIKFQNKENVFKFFEDSFDEHLAYDLMKNYLDLYDQDTKQMIYEKCLEKYYEYKKRVMGVTLDASFYGIQLALDTDFEFDYQLVLNTCASLYKAELEDFKKNSSVSELDKHIQDTYYFAMILYQAENLGFKQNIISESELSANISECIEYIIANNVENTETLFRVCQCLSNTDKKTDNVFKTYIEKYVQSYLENGYLKDTYYIIQLFLIDRTFGLNIVTTDVVISSMYDNEKESCYSEEAGEEATAKATFFFYALKSSNEGFVINQKELDEMHEEILLLSDNSLESYYYIYCLRSFSL